MRANTTTRGHYQMRRLHWAILRKLFTMQACMSQSVQQCDHDKQTTEGTNEDTHVENAENVDEGMWYFYPSVGSDNTPHAVWRPSKKHAIAPIIDRATAR